MDFSTCCKKREVKRHKIYICSNMLNAHIVEKNNLGWLTIFQFVKTKSHFNSPSYIVDDGFDCGDTVSLLSHLEVNSLWNVGVMAGYKIKYAVYINYLFICRLSICINVIVIISVLYARSFSGLLKIILKVKDSVLCKSIYTCS